MNIVLACDSNSVYKLKNLVNSIHKNNTNADIYLLTNMDVSAEWAKKVAIVELPDIKCAYRWGNYMYLKLYIDVCFPELDKVIYLDYDTIVLSDLSDLISGDFSIRAVKSGDGFNSGVMAINFTKCNFEVCRNMISEYTHDEKILNHVFKSDVEYIPPEWNYVPNSGKIQVNPKVIHYMGHLKPWDMVDYLKYYLEYE